MKTIAICNHKGGSGKSTTAVNLAAALAEQGRSTLLLDLDAQCSASQWLGASAEDRGLYAALTGDAELFELIQPTGVPSVAVIPSSAWMAGVEKALAGEIGAETILRGKLAALAEELEAASSQRKPEPPDTVTTGEYLKYDTGDPEKVWRAKYEEASPGERQRMTAERRERDTRRARSRRYDYAVLDCPPAMGALLVNALAAADRVIVPVEAHYMTLIGVTQILDTVRLVRERLHPSLAVGGVLACRVDRRTRHGQEVVNRMRRELGDAMFQTVIRENVRLAEAPLHHLPITRYDPRSPGAEDYRALATELLAREEQQRPPGHLPR